MWLGVKAGCNKVELKYNFYSDEQLKKYVSDNGGDFTQDLVQMHEQFFNDHPNSDADPVKHGLPYLFELDGDLDYKCFKITPTDDCCKDVWRFYCVKFQGPDPAKVDKVLAEIGEYASA